jgi:PAS domain S-box-containing protein
VPYAGVALAYALLVAVSRPWWGQALGVVVFGSVTISALVVVRQVAALRDNRRLVAARLARDAYFRGLIEHASDFVFVADLAGVMRYASPAGERAFGYPVGLGLGRPVDEWLHPDDVAAARVALGAAAADGTRSVIEARVRRADGTHAVVEAAIGRLPGDDPQLVLNVRDVTERAEAADALLESQRAIEALLRNLPGMAYRCRNLPDWPFEFASYGSAALTGYPAADLCAAPGAAPRVSYGALVHPGDRERLWAAVQAAIAERRPFEVRYRIATADGGARDVWEQGTAVFDAAGEVVALEGFVMDVTEQKRLESRLEHQAFHDPLTGLANRALFRDRVAQALARGARDGTRPAVLFLDLDDFKAVNDSLGHGEGDRLLVEVAARLLNATRGCDTVARLGGDEFAVLLP